MESRVAPKINNFGSLKISMYNGRNKAVNAEATETILARRIIKIQVRILKAITQLIPATLNDRPRRTPRVVATPFPPLKFKKIVQLCPRIQLRAVSMRKRSLEARGRAAMIRSPIKTTARRPFKISSNNTATPGPFPNTLKAFVAPTLPEPNLRMSTPFKTFPKI